MLESPRPRQIVHDYAPFDFPIVSVEKLPAVAQNKLGDAGELLTCRRTRRMFASPLSCSQLSDLLWHSSRTIQAVRDSSGFPWEHRPAPSAGGRHPIRLLIQQPTASCPCDLYLENEHALGRLAISSATTVELRAAAHALIKADRYTVLWFAAEIGRTASKYVEWESLIWRDAGALLAVLCLVAEGLGLAACPLGISGEPFLSATLESRGQVCGVGALAVGSRLRNERVDH